jgi:hypothetical protein
MRREQSFAKECDTDTVDFEDVGEGTVGILNDIGAEYGAATGEYNGEDDDAMGVGDAKGDDGDTEGDDGDTEGDGDDDEETVKMSTTGIKLLSFRPPTKNILFVDDVAASKNRG